MKTMALHTGGPMPEFENLRGVDGAVYGSRDFVSNILIIVFSCNHCPYVQAYEERMMTLQREYESKSVQMVAINSNDKDNYPDDSFEHMVERATLKKFNFLYLRDEDQHVANIFAASHTPQFFVFNRDRVLSYSGKMDDNWREPENVKETYLRNALDALITGQPVKIPETMSIGCTIKWK